MTKRDKIITIFLVFLILIILGVVTVDSVKADSVNNESVPTSTIGSINGPADVGSTTTTDPSAPTTVFVDECLDIGLGNGVGQTSHGLQPCELTEVDSGTPPTTAVGAGTRLPSTGGTTFSYILIGVILVIFGSALTMIRRNNVADEDV